jgi:hypothetical protein
MIQLHGAVDAAAKKMILNVGVGVADPMAELRNALIVVRRENPSLAEAERSGFIFADDWNLLAVLIPALSGEVSKGNYAAVAKLKREHRECVDSAVDELDKIYCNYK